jgi:YHS domain-containing protein
MKRSVLLVSIALVVLVLAVTLSGCPKKAEAPPPVAPTAMSNPAPGMPPPGEMKMPNGEKMPASAMPPAGEMKMPKEPVAPPAAQPGVKPVKGAAAPIKKPGTMATKPVSASLVKPGEAKCPVMGTVAKKSDMLTYDWNGKRYYLCCPSCVPKVKANPAKYLSHAGPATGQGDPIPPK